MDNIQNKDVKGSEGHVCGGGEGHSGSCHCMLCSMKGGGWHGRHSVLRIAVGVGLLLAAFSLGTEVGEHHGQGGHDREGWGNERFERHMMGGYERGQNVQYQVETASPTGQPLMMQGRQVIIKNTAVPATGTGTQMMMGN